MTDPVFVAAGYLVVVGGVALYAIALRRRVARAAARAGAIRAYADTAAEATPGTPGRRDRP